MQYWSYDLAPKQQRQQSDWSTTSDNYYPQTSVVNESPRYPMQYRSYDLAPKQQRQQSDWSTTSDDYYPQTSVRNETPRYPNVYKAFNNNYAYGGPKQESSRREDQVQHQQKPSSAKVQKKVRVTEPVGIVERQTEEDVQNREGRQETIDTMADGFIKRKHKGFELSKWNTFKLPS